MEDTNAQNIHNMHLEMGHTGPQGIQGYQGHHGEMGPTGPQGIQGYQGHHGEMGPTGPQGIHGHDGYRGERGYTGATGPCSEISSTFINMYSVMQQKILNSQPILFDTFSVCQGNCSHSPNSSEIWVWKSGYYHVSAIINQLQAGQFSLSKNGIVIPGSSYGSLTGSALQLICIIYISIEDINFPNIISPTGMACKIELVNNSANYPFITIYSYENSGNTISQNSASIALMLIK